MRVRNLDWTAFRLPFRGEFATAHTTFSHREGVIVRLTTDVGIVGLGEASPLPRDGKGALQEVLALLASAKTALIGKRVDEIESALRWPGRDRCAAAAVCCALDTAVCDALAKVAGISVAEFLAPCVSRSVVVNATVGASSTTDACKAALQARAASFACVKLKVGMTQNMEEEYERVANVRAALGPQMKLRLDANGAWGVEQAIRTIQALAACSLEFVEQPVRPGDLESMRRVREAVSTPIAADEDITDLDAAQHVLQLGAAQILVLKPMVIGGLRPARRIVERAQAAGAAVVVTTTLDAGVGAVAALHLAATLPQDSPACGLATGDLLASDLLVRPLAVNDGRMQLPERPGLGVELDVAKLQSYSGDKEGALR
ncbi:MAG: mandelate racemase/muconate lactonizing enzyme family protein [Deltaproteobacteria bacterium]|nr:mandelate racemase/muconate lactonizing enzyme family protein [Deltaproteobacteria bacterium]